MNLLIVLPLILQSIQFFCKSFYSGLLLSLILPFYIHSYFNKSLIIYSLNQTFDYNIFIVSFYIYMQIYNLNILLSGKLKQAFQRVLINIKKPFSRNPEEENRLFKHKLFFCLRILFISFIRCNVFPFFIIVVFFFFELLFVNLLS